MKDYLLTLLVAAAVTYVLTPVVRKFAAMIGAIKVEIRERDVHTAPVPVIGGLAMYAGLAAALLVANQIPQLHDAIANTGMVTGLLAAGGLLVVIGVIDDRWGMNALTKAAGQVAAGGIVVATGTQLSWLPLPGGNGRIFVPTPDQQTLLTILIVVATINAVNFIDGLDGLAAGIVAIAAMSFFAYYYSLTKLADISSLAAPALASAVLIGMCLGFLPHNFAPAKIFMGDTGSMLLGLVLAYAPISGINSLDPAQLTGSINRYEVIMPLLLPALLLVIPYGDMLLAVVRRTRAGQSPFAADRKHLHHRLLDIGHSQRASVLIMYLWAATFSGTVVWLSVRKTKLPRGGNHHGEPVIVFVIITVVAVAILVLLTLPWRHWAQRAGARRSPAVAPTAAGPGIAAGATARQPGVSDLVSTGAAARPAGRASGLRAPAEQGPAAAPAAAGAVRGGVAEPDGSPAHGTSAREEPSQPGDYRGDGGVASAWYARPDPPGNVSPGGGAGQGDGSAADSGLPADRWQGGDGDPGDRGDTDRSPLGDGDAANGRHEPDRWQRGPWRPGSGRHETDPRQRGTGDHDWRQDTDRWQRGAGDPDDGRYDISEWPRDTGPSRVGWSQDDGGPAGLDGAGNGIRAELDRTGDQDSIGDEPTDGHPGRSAVGTVPPANDWSWFGPAASSNPDSRDR